MRIKQEVAPTTGLRQVAWPQDGDKKQQTVETWKHERPHMEDAKDKT